MAQDVCITIKSTQKTEEDSDTTELFTFGTMSELENGYSIEYEESEATGFEGSRVSLEVKKDIVTMIRTGTALSTLVIEKGKKHHCHYGTPFGNFLVGISTDRIETDLNTNGGKIKLKYTIDINSGFISENEMEIEIKPSVKERTDEK